MTLREIIYDVLEHLNAYSDDHKFSEEHIAYMINVERNAILKGWISNLKKDLPLEAMQTICLDLEIDSNCFGDLRVLKSKEKVPSTLNSTGRSNLSGIYTGDRFQKYINIVDYARIPYLLSEKYNSNMLYVAVDPKSYLVIANPDEAHLLLESIEVEAIFENPELAYGYDCEVEEELENSNSNLTSGEFTPIDFWDTEYPVESAIVSTITSNIIRKLSMKYRIPMDEINNAESDIKVNTNARRK